MRIRLRYTEHGPIRFLGHRDLARCWERAIRRAGLPIAYSEGFSPRPKLHFGLALSVGYESEAEYLDIDLLEPVDVESLPALLSPMMPAGVDVVDAGEIPRSALALQAAVEVVEWHVWFDQLDVVELAACSQRLLDRDEVIAPLERKGSVSDVDIRPTVLELRSQTDERGGAMLCARLATRPRAIRPRELLAALEAGVEPRLVTRHAQWMTIDGHETALLGPIASPDAPLERLAS